MMMAYIICNALYVIASLRFQPTKRPQLSNQKPKSRIPSSRVPVPAPLSNNPGPISLENAAATARLPAKMSIAEWTAEGEGIDCGGFYEGEKRQRGGRKKRKKTKDEPQAIQNWDSLYDPSRPNNFEDYKYSEEKMLEARDWKDKLYAHRVARQPDSDSDSSNDLYKSPLNSTFILLHSITDAHMITGPFAPQRLNFAPPTDFEKISQSQQTLFSDNDLDNPVGKGAYEQRLRSSQFAHQPDTVNGSEDSSQRTPLSSGPSLPASNESVFIRSIQSPTSNAAAFPSISRAPVRYNLPAAPADIPASEAELEEALRTDQMEEELQPDAATRSLRPGQKGFAERLMSKYGWSKGSGLGVSGSGIIKPLRVQIEKQKKKSDSEGGGFVGPGGRGKIVGGMKKGAPSGETRVGKYGAMSEVIILRGIVDGMNLDAELEGVHDGGLLQEIGDECGEKASMKSSGVLPIC